MDERMEEKLSGKLTGESDERPEGKPAGKTPEKAGGYLRIPLEEPLQYEGRILEELDLSGYEKLTLSDLNEIYGLYEANGGAGVVMQEGSLLFAQCTAAHVLKLPVEALGALKARDAVKLKSRTYRFFYL